MFKISVILIILLLPGTLMAQDIYGQTTRTGPHSSITTLRDSNGGEATIMLFPPGQIMIRTIPGITPEDMDRSQQNLNRSIRELDGQSHNDSED